jgi:hypothetical protein
MEIPLDTCISIYRYFIQKSDWKISITKSIYYCRVTTIWRVWLKHLWNKKLPRAYEKGVQPIHRSGARRAKKGPIAVANDVLFWCFHIIFLIFFNSNPQFWEKFQSVPGTPTQSCSALQNFSWRPCNYHICFVCYNKKSRRFSIHQINIFIYKTEKQLQSIMSINMLIVFFCCCFFLSCWY